MNKLEFKTIMETCGAVPSEDVNHTNHYIFEGLRFYYNIDQGKAFILGRLSEHVINSLISSSYIDEESNEFIKFTDDKKSICYRENLIYLVSELRFYKKFSLCDEEKREEFHGIRRDIINGINHRLISSVKNSIRFSNNSNVDSRVRSIVNQFDKAINPLGADLELSDKIDRLPEDAVSLFSDGGNYHASFCFEDSIITTSSGQNQDGTYGLNFNLCNNDLHVYHHLLLNENVNIIYIINEQYPKGLKFDLVNGINVNLSRTMSESDYVILQSALEKAIILSEEVSLNMFKSKSLRK